MTEATKKQNLAQEGTNLWFDRSSLSSSSSSSSSEHLYGEMSYDSSDIFPMLLITYKHMYCYVSRFWVSSLKNSKPLKDEKETCTLRSYSLEDLDALVSSLELLFDLTSRILALPCSSLSSFSAFIFAS